MKFKSHKIILQSWLLIMLLIPNIFYSQEKQKLEIEDFDLWHTLLPQEISNKGNWISYSLMYECGNDTLFIKNVNNQKQLYFPLGSKGKFSSDEDWFAYFNGEKGLSLINLKSGVEYFVPEALRFDFSSDGRYLVALNDASAGTKREKKKLVILDLENNQTHRIKNVTEYKINEGGERIAYFIGAENKKSVMVMELEDGMETREIISNNLNPYRRLTWHSSGNAIAFFEEFEDPRYIQNNHKVFLCSDITSSADLFVFDPSKCVEFPKGSYIANTNATELIISDDLESVFFHIQPGTMSENEKNNIREEERQVQIWRSSDKLVFPRLKKTNYASHARPVLSAWWPKTGRYLKIGTQDYATTVLTGNQKYAFSYSYYDYLPRFEHKEEYTDIYLTNLSTGTKKLFLKKQLRDRNVVTSPGGGFIGYFKDRHWWVYDLKKHTHTNVTKNLGVPVYNENYDMAGTPPAYGNPGWTEGDEQILIYDQYDIWMISPDGKIQKRLTHGRQDRITYRIYEFLYTNYIFDDFKGYEGHSFDLKNDLVFEAYGNISKESGYYYWNEKSGLREIIFGNSHINFLKKARNEDALMFMEQKFNVPRQIHYRAGSKPIRTIVKSNSQHHDFFWGKSELVNYTSSSGKQLQGALFYPANYQRGKKYPMIVNIYQRKSQLLHHYKNPSLYIMDGFNRTNFTNDGYFVLLPDIVYKLRDPGISAVDCVVAAVNAVLKKGIVDKGKVGLIGHSFGGYETNFIVTQTDMFTAAVAGAAANNMLSFYLTMGWNTGKPDLWRFESQQWRFGDSYFNIPEAYERNSPIHNAENIHTPLLSWTGNGDMQVNWYQGIELYIALRRLKKEHIFLVYPAERHVILKPENQKDLYFRIKDWFDFYLKGNKPADWINKENN